MRTQVFGDIRVDSVKEYDFEIAPDYLLANVTREEAAEHMHWLGLRHMNPANFDLRMTSHAYLIRTRHHTIIFDTCNGNDKERPYEMTWHHLNYPFLERLAKFGVKPEDVDYVMCSHLHADHIGWNTRLVNGEWVPTFPNARYLISKSEHEWWKDAIENKKVKEYRKVAWDDSILPVVDRGLARFVDDNHVIENEMPDEVRYMPLRGHTKYHCGLYVCSQKQDAIFTGDAIHHPVQLARPDWLNAGFDAPQATQTIRDIIDRTLDKPTKLMTAHFASPTAGNVVSGPKHPIFRLEDE